MRMVMVSVFDNVAKCFGRPVFVQTTGVAIRSFADEVNKADSQDDLSKHPEDFQLYRVGEFDDNSGEVFGILPELLVKAVDVCRS